MLAKSRRKLDMGMRVVEFSRLHPDSSPALAAAVTRLQERLARADQLAHQQMDGRSALHVATARKVELRRLMKRTHLHHLTSVAEVASVEEPELARKFVFPRDTTTYRGFQTAASGMAAEAQSRKDLLLKHGLAEEVLTGLEVALDQFETVAEQGAAGRLEQVGASTELVTVAEEVVQIVKVMSGLIRIRFAGGRNSWRRGRARATWSRRPSPRRSRIPVPRSRPGERRPRVAKSGRQHEVRSRCTGRSEAPPDPTSAGLLISKAKRQAGRFDRGLASRLQASYGRVARILIERGDCHLKKES